MVKATSKGGTPAARAPTSRPERHARRDGTLESVGQWAGKHRVGAWKFYHHDGKTLKAVGKYDDAGRFTGLWKWYGADGRLRQWGRFEEGQQVGLWKRFHGGTDQLCDIGRYAAGKRTGAWTFFDKQGNVRRTQQFK